MLRASQNRTLCEVVRRRRNDASWATGAADSQAFREDVLAVWGIGPSKVETYCPDMVAVLARGLPAEKLASSRGGADALLIANSNDAATAVAGGDSDATEEESEAAAQLAISATKVAREAGAPEMVHRFVCD
jgi:hypothetical protein